LTVEIAATVKKNLFTSQ